MTEEEQLEIIKKWWQKHSTLITILLSIILLSASGYKYWRWHQEKITAQASNAYEHLMVAFANQDYKGVQSYSNQLITQYSHTVYASAARLTLSKLDMNNEEFDKAKKELDYVANNAPVSALKQIARIRIARLFVAKKAYQQALSELAQVDDEAYIPVVNEIKGDIYAATGKYQDAILAYKKAMSQVRTHGVGNLYLEMKTNELTALTQSVNDASHLQTA